ncbi:response regulator [Sphingomonas sp. DT-51]|uniref:response regulator n=1 Tax=Sphingomonas sp. DT-51 TaxID=3396165 RepID=UPI003F1DDB25
MSDDQRAPVILVVDDEPLVRSTVCEQLQNTGYDVRTAASGDEAFDMINGGVRFDVLLTDIRMPGSLDGFGLIRRVLALVPSARTIAMSGYVGDDHLETRAADRFIGKPFTMARLQRELSDLLQPGTC